MYINFLKYKKIYFAFSAFLILGSLVSLLIFGLNLGIDFTGGSILEIEYKNSRPSNQEIKENISDLDLGTIYLQPSGENGLIIRMKEISEEVHQNLLRKLNLTGQIEERRFESIGPTIGRELKEKTKILILIALFSIVLYIAFSFRRVQKPLSSWQYGLASLVALFHDVFLPIGIFSILGEFFGIQITIPVVIALLIILGYSINNTVVVFDRIRENLIRGEGVTFEETVNKSLSQALVRCLNTAFTTLLVLITIFFWGGVTLKYFALTLIIGITAGTYSSLFLTSSLLVGWLFWRKKGI